MPLSHLLDEREKRQAAQAARETAEKRLAEYEANREPPAPLTPDEAIQQTLYTQNLRASRRFADREYGKEMMGTVHDWAAKRCDEDPSFNQTMRTAEDPYEAAVQAFNREQVLANVQPSDLEEFNNWKATRAQALATTIEAAQTPVTAKKPAAAIPRSLADASGNGATGQAHTPVGEGLAFQSIFTRR